MPTETYKDFDLLDNSIAEEAYFSLTFSRNADDSYIVDFETVKSDVEIDLTKKDVMPLLPIGSDWRKAVGWRSIFGIPFKIYKKQWIALGMREIVNHEKRGAYPIQKIFFSHTTRFLLSI